MPAGKANDMHKSATYQYESLTVNLSSLDRATDPGPCFRLLTLHPGEATEPIACALSIHTLTAALEYEAISYHWGDGSKPHEILCSGKSLYITDSLHSALLRFRLTDRPRQLWADAICIAQHDVLERDSQVAIMGKIYSLAQCVLIWLGEVTSDDANALKTVEEMDLVLPNDIDDLEGMTWTQRHEAESIDTALERLRGFPVSTWTDLVSLLRNPWFTRVWIIQEVLLARSAQLHSGSHSLPWDTFISVMIKIQKFKLDVALQISEHAPAGFTNILLVLADPNNVNQPLFKLLCFARSFQSTDPRDKIIGLLGLADQSDVPWEIITYEKSKLVFESGSLNHLVALNYKHDDADIRLPSWVPDWSRMLDRVPLLSGDIDFGAGGSTAPCLSVADTGNRLIIVGKTICRIARLGTIRYSDLTTIATSRNFLENPADARSATLQWFSSWFAQCHAVAFGSDFCMTKEEQTSARYQSFCKAMFCYNESTEPGLNDAVSRLTSFHYLLAENITIDTNGSDLPETEIVGIQQRQLRIIYDLDEYLGLMCSTSYLFADDQGNLGWAPRRAKVGNTICVFLGASSPNVLRPTGPDDYEVIGDCYVHGCENGAFIADHDYLLEEYSIV